MLLWGRKSHNIVKSTLRIEKPTSCNMHPIANVDIDSKNRSIKDYTIKLCISIANKIE